MRQEEVLKKLQDIIEPYLEKTIDLRLETDLMRDLSLNSVDIVNIAMEVEDTFECTIELEKLPSINSVNDFIQYILML